MENTQDQIAQTKHKTIKVDGPQILNRYIMTSRKLADFSHRYKLPRVRGLDATAEHERVKSKPRIV